jgi:hypothetical protein
MTSLNIPSGKESEDSHVIYATTRVNSFTLFLLSLFYCRQNLCQVNRQFFRRTSRWSKSRSFSQVSSIKTFDFSTLYTTLPHDKLKTRLKETIHKAFLIPDSCRATVRNGNSISPDITEDNIENFGTSFGFYTG